MTKDEEVELLRKTSIKLGSDSYSGRWFRGVMPMIEDLIRQDLCVDELDPLFVRNQCREMLESAKKEAEAIRSKAQMEAEFVRAEARQYAGNVKDNLRYTIQDVLAKL